jgi:hypothetical protein
MRSSIWTTPGTYSAVWYIRLGSAYYYNYCGSTALSWALAVFFLVSRSYTQPVGLLGRGISPSQGFYLHTEQHEHRINAHNIDIHALSGIQTPDPSVWACEDNSWLRPRSHGDRRIYNYLRLNLLHTIAVSLRRFINLSVKEEVSRVWPHSNLLPVSSCRAVLQTANPTD